MLSATRAALLVVGAALLMSDLAAASPRVFLCVAPDTSCACVPENPNQYYVVHGLSDGSTKDFEVCLRTDETPSPPATTLCEQSSGATGNELCAWQIVLEGNSDLSIVYSKAGVPTAGVEGLVTTTDLVPTLVVNWVDTTAPTSSDDVIWAGTITLTVPGSGFPSPELSVTSDSEAVDADFDPVPLAIDQGIVAAPEPGAGWMFFAGLVGLAWLAGMRRLATPALALALAVGAAGPVEAQIIQSASKLTPADLSLGAGESADRALAPIGDINGDGVEDLAVGLPAANTGQGALMIVMLRRDGTVWRLFRLENGVNGVPAVMGPNAGFGASVASLGDLDGAGPSTTTLAVVAPGDSRLWILSLQKQAVGHGIFLQSETHFNLSEPARSVANVGDLQNIGLTTLALGHPDYSVTGCANCGAVSLLTLDADGGLASSVFLANGSGGVPSLAPNEFFGAALAPVGDYNGDNVPDLVVGAPGFSANGSFLLLSLSASGEVVAAERYTENSLGLPSLGAGAALGAAMTPIPDGEGGDAVGIFVGAPNAMGRSSANSGAVIVALRNSEGSLELLTIVDEGSSEIPQAFGPGTQVGQAIALVDVTGDGLQEVFVDAAHDPNGDDVGVYVLKLTDTDSDGIPDPADSCPFVPDQNEADSDSDGVGDLCDNCPDVANAAQTDTDGDGTGDACERVKLVLTAVGSDTSPKWSLDLDCGAEQISALQLSIVAPRGNRSWVDSLIFGGGCAAPPSRGGLGCVTDPFNLGSTIDPLVSGAFLTDVNGTYQNLQLRSNTLYVEVVGVDSGNGPLLCGGVSGSTFLGSVVSSGPGVGEPTPALSLSVGHDLSTAPVLGLNPGSGAASVVLTDFHVTTSNPAGGNRGTSNSGGGN
ncbi:MAG: thrombospondin type 3 repeat-containing protein [Myxococcota bacterium]|nr:thrombospondin type 3 repeat-containing protein [Myxococcota bacterium]